MYTGYPVAIESIDKGTKTGTVRMGQHEYSFKFSDDPDERPKTPVVGNVILVRLGSGRSITDWNFLSNEIEQCLRSRAAAVPMCCRNTSPRAGIHAWTPVG